MFIQTNFCVSKFLKRIVFSDGSICALDFPHGAVHEMPELTAESPVSIQNTAFVCFFTPDFIL